MRLLDEAKNTIQVQSYKQQKLFWGPSEPARVHDSGSFRPLAAIENTLHRTTSSQPFSLMYAENPLSMLLELAYFHQNGQLVGLL